MSLQKRTAIVLVLAAVGFGSGSGPLLAHHAFSAEFDDKKPVKLQGRVTKVEWINPHAWIHIDVKGADGAVVNWMIEGGSPNSLMRLGLTKNALLPGMEIVVEGFQAKDGSNRGVGRVLAFADGRRLFLGDPTEGRGGPPRH